MSISSEDIYEHLLAKLTEDQIESEVRKKMSEFSTTPQMALFLIAKDYNIDYGSTSDYSEYEQEVDYLDYAIDIKEIKEEGMPVPAIVGRIHKVFRIGEFTRKDQSQGRYGSFLVQDKSGTIKVVLWDKNVEHMETDYFQEGEVICIVGGIAKRGKNEFMELHTRYNSKVILSPDGVDKYQFSILLDFQDYTKSTDNSTVVPIFEVLKKEGFVSAVKGVIQKIYFNEYSKKDGGVGFKLSVLLKDEESSIWIIAWDMRAIQTLKLISEGQEITFSSLFIKYNDYKESKELRFTKNTTFS